MKSHAQRNGLLFKVFILALLIGFGSFGTANALSISQTLYTPELRSDGSSPPINSTLSFQQFNTTLENGNIGILNSVLVTVAGSVLADFSMQNTSATAVDLASSISGRLYAQLNGTNIVTINSSDWASTYVDGLAAGATFTDNSVSSGIKTGSKTLTSTTDLALFSGTGLVDILAYTNLMVTTGISGGTNYLNSSTAWAQEGITVTYYYTDGGVPPVPEPATLLLFGSGIAGLLGYGYKKKRSSNIA